RRDRRGRVRSGRPAHRDRRPPCRARRGEQYAGSPESPDVVCPALAWIHFEVKLRERLDIYDAMEQARRECGGKVPVVAHRRSQWPWLITIEAEVFFRFLSGELPPEDVEARILRAGERGILPRVPDALPGRAASPRQPGHACSPRPGGLGQPALPTGSGEEFGAVLENGPTQKEKGRAGTRPD
ncbi:MAG TPA: hypothetical protein VNZ22_22640, partial [Bacillota bacterium]|nr:hypothetical protein [Bacillota bacterium]